MLPFILTEVRQNISHKVEPGIKKILVTNFDDFESLKKLNWLNYKY